MTLWKEARFCEIPAALLLSAELLPQVVLLLLKKRLQCITLGTAIAMRHKLVLHWPEIHVTVNLDQKNGNCTSLVNQIHPSVCQLRVSKRKQGKGLGH